MAIKLILCNALLAGVGVLAANGSNATQQLCNTLASQVPGKVFSSAGDAGNYSAAYAEATGRYWDSANADDEPACVFFPSSAQDVSSAMKLLNAAPNVPFALKSGGHNFNRGYSSTNAGVLITFRPNMNYTRPSQDLNSAEVGPGSRWSEVMAVLDPLHRCAVGGRNSDVGVGGYITHGGLSYLTSQYGFASDNVISFQIVTAEGVILDVSQQSHPDLFWALRGGGNLYGVVTKYTLNIHPIGNVWGGSRLYTQDKAPQIFAAVSNFIANFNETKAALIPTTAWLPQLGGQYVITMFFFWDGDTPPAHVFAEFDKIPSVNDLTKTQRYPELLVMDVPITQMRTADAVSSLPNMPPDKMVEFLNWHTAEANNATYLHDPSNGWAIFNMALQPIPAGLQQQSFKRGPAALTTNPLHGDKLWIEYSLGWENATCDQTCPKQLLNIVNAGRLHQQQKYAGVLPTNFKFGDLRTDPYNPLFANDAHAAQQVFKSYGQPTSDQMSRIQVQYDPNGMFLRQTGGFKL